MNVGSLGLARCSECCYEKQPHMRTVMEISPLLKSTKKVSLLVYQVPLFLKNNMPSYSKLRVSTDLKSVDCVRNFSFIH